MRISYPGRLLSLLFLLVIAVAAFGDTVKETVLPNGLKVLIKEVHAAPVVVVDAWYKVGSRNEHPGITGASHLLEHMTYKGSTEFDRDTMRSSLRRNGALDNGATFYDYTHYYTTIASDRIDLPLRIEAARMHSALLHQQDLDSENTVVRSELEGRENDPGTLLFEGVMSTAYKSHPYRWPVVGWRTDVEHTTAKQLQDYYHTYYAPNNATLVVVGDVNADKVLAAVKKYYGVLPRKNVPSLQVPAEPEQREARRITVKRQGRVPMVEIAWHIPGVSDNDIPAIMMLEQILGSGRTSRVYQKVVETKLGVSAWAETLMLKDPGLFIVGGAAAPQSSVKPIETTLLSEVERIKTTPPTAEEMARALRQADASLIYARDSVTEQAEQLGYYETIAGNWRYSDQLPALLRKVTAADVSRVAKKYLVPEHSTVGIFEPTDKDTAAPAPQNTVAPPAGYRSAGHDDPIKLGVGKPAMALGTQTAAPAAKAAVRRERFTLPNGLVLIVQENHANSTVAISASMKAGHAYDPAGKAGLADMVANLLDRGTITRSSNQIATELEGAAAELSENTGWETMGFRGKALSSDTALLIRNIADMSRNANFPQEELEKAREQALAGLAMNRDQPEEIAMRTFYRAAMPENSPYRMPSIPEEEAGVKALTRDDLLAFYHARYTPQTMVMAVVGDVNVDKVRALVEKYFGDWKGETPNLLSFTTTTPQKEAYFISYIPDKSEVDIYAGHAGELRRSDPDYYAATIMNLILGGGGALNSRLGDVIRVQHGLAYSVYSAFHASTGAGPWYTMLGVNPTNTDKAIDLLKAEIARMRDNGVTTQEVEDAKAFVTGAHAIALETNTAIAGELLDAEYFHLGMDYPERYTKLYSAVTPDAVSAAAKKYLHPDKLVISIAGPYSHGETGK